MKSLFDWQRWGETIASIISTSAHYGGVLGPDVCGVGILVDRERKMETDFLKIQIHINFDFQAA